MLNLVTGATGFLGRRLAERLVANDSAVRLFVRDPNRLPDPLSARCEVFSGDLGDPISIEAAVAGSDVIFHCAANVKPWDTPAAYHAANVIGVDNLLRAIERTNPSLQRLVHLSTVDVYGFPESPCDEDCPLDGGGFGYGESKLAGERLVRQFGEETAIPVTIFRPTNIFGPGSPFVAGIGDAMNDGLMLKIDGGQADAGVVDVDNLIDYLLWAASAPKAVGQTYNVSDDYAADWDTVLRELKYRIEARGWILNLPYGVAAAAATLFEGVHRVVLPHREPLLHRLLVRMLGRTCGHSARKLREHSGIISAINFADCMQRSAAWYLDARNR